MRLRQFARSIPGARNAYRAIRGAAATTQAVLATDRISIFFRRANAAVGTPRFYKELERKADLRTGDPEIDLQLVKAINLLVNKHEYRQFTVRKVGRPSGFMLDTANACQLGCPSCQHSSNRQWAALTYKPMVKGAMKPDTFERFIRQTGLRSYAGHFYNNSEPFLNRRTPDYIREANLYRVQTLVSSNMSIPKLDAEAIVASGLTTLMTAIDGATQESYERYRRGGNLELVLENVAAIVRAKKKLGSATPILRWQYLTFEHNVHEIPQARSLARRIGWNVFNTATPYDVSSDEPSVRATAVPRILDALDPVGHIGWAQPVARIAYEIDAALEEKLTEDTEARATPAHGHCDWLHLSLVADALGSIRPCPIPDYVSHGECTFGNLDGEIFNGAGHIAARSYFAGKPHGGNKCVGCNDRPYPQVGLGIVLEYFALAGSPFAYFVRESLTNWSEHAH
jgi:MoaA/NifB/PqqE/SkfB family radical SAM enzyme